MAFLRFTRDKRGYEHFYLVEATPNRKGKLRSRLLYWFRTPPNVKVGREPFDENVRRLLEANNPDVVFDWRAILETPIPSAEAERWRERRRAEKAARVIRRSEDDSRSQDAERSEDDRVSRSEDERVEAADVGAFDEPPAAETAAAETFPISAAEVTADLSAPAEPEAASATPPANDTHRRKRRRRRGRKGRKPAASPEAGAADQSARAEDSPAEGPQALDDEPDDGDDEESPSEQ